jgi:hypothetical protein
MAGKTGKSELKRSGLASENLSRQAGNEVASSHGTVFVPWAFAIAMPAKRAISEVARSLCFSDSAAFLVVAPKRILGGKTR